MTRQTTTKFYVGLNNSDMDKQTVQPQNLIDYVKDHFRGATLYESKGVWMGETENSMVIEIVGDIQEQTTSSSLASLMEKEKNKDEEPKQPHTVLKETLEDLFNQDSVMVMRDEKKVMF